MTQQNSSLAPKDPIFNLPAVDIAYKPSGKLTVRGLGFMLLFGFVGSALAGVVIFYGGEFCVGFGSMFGLVGGFLGMIFYFVAIPCWSGMGLAIIIFAGSMIGKSRNPKTAMLISFCGSLIAVLVYSFFRAKKYDLEAYDSGVDFLKVAAVLGCISVSSVLGVRHMLFEVPYCDQCDEEMSKITTPQVPSSKLDVLMKAGKDSQFDIFFNEFYQGQTSLDLYLMAVGHYCKKCRVRGFVELLVEQVIIEVNNGQKSTRKESKRIFSAPIKEADISILLARANAASAK